MGVTYSIMNYSAKRKKNNLEPDILHKDDVL